MRTTIVIDDDVLVAAKAMAEQQRQSVGKIISDLARRSLRKPPSGQERNGIPLLASRADGSPVTLDIVNALRDETP
ncbi:CopG family transcriptional regulator [Labrys wisconsinensis]|uniref:CopG family transcriptional regulator n=1 Tax=Labrys wisconsinensis TaxID=425677 RepID=A0ABU0JHB4_9HYPH|nr:CopG family transcriptional regulator [Labrys wisconsinensis]MDQ0473678.1 hypothetical protein [Labrys wisconsinensis]